MCCAAEISTEQSRCRGQSTLSVKTEEEELGSHGEGQAVNK